MPARALDSKIPSRQRLLPHRGPVAVEDIREALVIREGGTFLLTDTEGNVAPGNTAGLGLYHADTRHLSGYDFTLRNVRPVLLTSSAELGFAQEQVLTNPNMIGQGGRKIERQTIEMRRLRAISNDIVEETLRVTNFNIFPITLDLLYLFEADFADIFEIRGYERESTGKRLATQMKAQSIHFRYRGVDKRTRVTNIQIEPKPIELTEKHALQRVTLGHLESAVFTLEIQFGPDDESRHETVGSHFKQVAADYSSWFAEVTTLETDNQLFNAVLRRSLNDVRILRAHTLDGLEYPAAGTPWFDALFGRDSCITALQMLPYRPDIARNVLQLLARMQGREERPERDEEPGKILHEFRSGEMALSGELPFAPYYGSIDSTPLFLVLAREYLRWTGDLKFIRSLVPTIRAALRWMDDYGDPNGRGWLAYEKRSDRGLVNQGWKDSWDSTFHADGTLLKAPIALSEVQGYAYAARRAAADMFRQLGDSALGDSLDDAARSLREAFNRAFWMPRERFYAVALDGEGKAAGAITSNPGQALWSGIVSPRKAQPVATRLMANDMFSGWGIRTLSSESPRFNPYGYHVGTVWPHDNSLIAAGLKKYGFIDETNEVFGALFEAAQTFLYYRLPELFGGSSRAPHQTPVDYPVACKPQAWAAGSVPMILSHVLGLAPDAINKRLEIVRPQLPPWLREVNVSKLRVGEASVDLSFKRTNSHTRYRVTALDGELAVSSASSWPD